MSDADLENKWQHSARKLTCTLDPLCPFSSLSHRTMRSKPIESRHDHRTPLVRLLPRPPSVITPRLRAESWFAQSCAYSAGELSCAGCSAESRVSVSKDRSASERQEEASRVGEQQIEMRLSITAAGCFSSRIATCRAAIQQTMCSACVRVRCCPSRADEARSLLHCTEPLLLQQ